MTWEFKVGQKVVCVDDRPGAVLAGTLTKGDVYTISLIYPSGFDRTLGIPNQVLIALNERPHPDVLLYGCWRFRPLVTDTQSWLKEVLETPPPVNAEQEIAYIASRL